MPLVNRLDGIGFVIATTCHVLLGVSCTPRAPRQTPDAAPSHLTAQRLDHETKSIASTSLLDDWESWREATIAALLEPDHDDTGTNFLQIESVARNSRSVFTKLRAAERRHPLEFASRTPLSTSLGNLKRFTLALRMVANPAHSSGFSIDNRAYIRANREHIQFPDLLRSESFLKSISDPSTYREALRSIEEANSHREPDDRWLVLIYKSQFLKTSDEKSYGRFLIYVPGETEKWIQFGIATPGMKDTKIHSVSIVALRPTGKSSQPHECYIVDFWRRYLPDRVDLLPMVEAGRGTQNCYNCHKTPVIPIRPAEEYEFNENGALVVKRSGRGEIPARLNRLIKRHGPPDFGGLLDPDAYGPPLGPANRVRPDSLLRQAAAGLGLGAGSFDKIRKNMKCSECHDGRDRGSINFPQALVSNMDLADLIHPDTGKSMPLVKTYVENGWMPPGNSLTAAERKALHRALMLEYYDLSTGTGLFVDWLNGRSSE